MVAMQPTRKATGDFGLQQTSLTAARGNFLINI